MKQDFYKLIISIADESFIQSIHGLCVSLRVLKSDQLDVHDVDTTNKQLRL